MSNNEEELRNAARNAILGGIALSLAGIGAILLLDLAKTVASATNTSVTTTTIAGGSILITEAIVFYAVKRKGETE
jgi:hypothetical protein